MSWLPYSLVSSDPKHVDFGINPVDSLTFASCTFFNVSPMFPCLLCHIMRVCFMRMTGMIVPAVGFAFEKCPRRNFSPPQPGVNLSGPK